MGWKCLGSHESIQWRGKKDDSPLFSFTTGSCSWPVNPEIIGFVCWGWNIFSSYSSSQLWFNASLCEHCDSHMLQAYESFQRWEVSSSLLPDITPCTYLHVLHGWNLNVISYCYYSRQASFLFFPGLGHKYSNSIIVHKLYFQQTNPDRRWCSLCLESL